MKNKIIILFQPLFMAVTGLVLVFSLFTGFTYIKILKYLISEGMEFRYFVSITAGFLALLLQALVPIFLIIGRKLSSILTYTLSIVLALFVSRVAFITGITELFQGIYTWMSKGISIHFIPILLINFVIILIHLILDREVS